MTQPEDTEWTAADRELDRRLRELRPASRAPQAVQHEDRTPECGSAPTDHREQIAEHLAGHAGSKAFLAEGNEWEHIRSVWRAHADAVLRVPAIAEAEKLRAEHAALKRAHIALAEQAGRDQAAITRVRDLHVRNPHTGDCEHCSARNYPDYAVPHPCPTIAALDAPKEPRS